MWGTKVQNEGKKGHNLRTKGNMSNRKATYGGKRHMKDKSAKRGTKGPHI